MPDAISLISRSRCAMAASLVVYRCWASRSVDVCCRVRSEKDLSVSESRREGSANGVCVMEGDAMGAVRPPRVRSSIEEVSVSGWRRAYGDGRGNTFQIRALLLSKRCTGFLNSGCQIDLYVSCHCLVCSGDLTLPL